MHVRQQIRDEVASRLISYGIGASVYVARVYTLQVFPSVIIYSDIEEAESDILGVPSVSHRELTVTIEVYSKAGTDAFDDEIDVITESIELALANAASKFIMCKRWEYRGMKSEYSKQGDKGAGVAQLEYVFTYRVAESDPATGV